jgi:hypothetical protein
MAPLITAIERATMARHGCLSSGQALRAFGVATITEAEHDGSAST